VTSICKLYFQQVLLKRYSLTESSPLSDWRTTVNTGNMETLRILAGFTYQGARGVKQDLKRAAEMYQTAADGGDRIAMAELGRMYFFGIGVPKDVTRAMNLF
jgi:uncharacterized protein